ncbi:hypothetical protein TRIATDRAFT_296858 [Trichoderma atroviride IMI 206040]|uniref:Uncharacterized protein n=1 Tax=Hypocrea atroviridis (strain ATCC 20476 / IMI 206040) TaxID=452589 RepID=G9NED2_HYPAI|nr:uncharacterized protein TRIATDRAFT_296858 [Trichoderma atroviride IMI 206040]EHK51038.1 hypothetical protein TRIATDRAFT_296858 [Trichoderma atroviride IMI 206040]
MPCYSVPGQAITKAGHGCPSASSLLFIPAARNLFAFQVFIGLPRFPSRSIHVGGIVAGAPVCQSCLESSISNHPRLYLPLTQPNSIDAISLAAGPVTCKCWRARTRMGEMPEPKRGRRRSGGVIKGIHCTGYRSSVRSWPSSDCVGSVASTYPWLHAWR